LSLEKSRPRVKPIRRKRNRHFEFHKRSKLFIGTHNETLSVVAMCVGNPDYAPVRIRC
jgi:hypothetical protein